MSEQRGLFDPKAAELARDRAIKRAGDHNGRLVDEAVDAVRRLCARGLTRLTTDDLWKVLGDAGAAEPRALGAAMRIAQREGLIRPTDAYKQSERVACHRRPLRVWEVVHR